MEYHDVTFVRRLTVPVQPRKPERWFSRVHRVKNRCNITSVSVGEILYPHLNTVRFGADVSPLSQITSRTKRCVNKSWSSVQLRRSLTGSEFPSRTHLHSKSGTPLEHVLSHSNDITDQQVIQLAPEVWDYLTRTFCPHHRGSGEIIQGRRGHETRNVQVRLRC